MKIGQWTQLRHRKVSNARIYATMYFKCFPAMLCSLPFTVYLLVHKCVLMLKWKLQHDGRQLNVVVGRQKLKVSTEKSMVWLFSGERVR